MMGTATQKNTPSKSNFNVGEHVQYDGDCDDPKARPNSEGRNVKLETLRPGRLGSIPSSKNRLFKCKAKSEVRNGKGYCLPAKCFRPSSASSKETRRHAKIRLSTMDFRPPPPPPSYFKCRLARRNSISDQKSLHEYRFGQ